MTAELERTLQVGGEGFVEQLAPFLVTEHRGGVAGHEQQRPASVLLGAFPLA